MLPAASVSGWYFGHPEARYFAVDRVTRDQVENYANERECRSVLSNVGSLPILRTIRNRIVTRFRSESMSRHQCDDAWGYGFDGISTIRIKALAPFPRTNGVYMHSPCTAVHGIHPESRLASGTRLFASPDSNSW